MGEPKWTPGPWGIYADDPLVITDADHCSVGEMSSGNPFIDMETQKANARLSAAAPELYALCAEMVDCLDPKMVEAHDSGGLAAMGITHSDEGCSLCKARRILARARGES